MRTVGERVSWSLALLAAFLFGLVVGVLFGVTWGRSLPVYSTLHVYTDGNPNAWTVKGLDEAEKKAHFLLYECDAKMAVIALQDGQMIAQVRKGDGRDIGTD